MVILRFIAMMAVFIFTLKLLNLGRKKSQNKITWLEYRKKALPNIIVIAIGLIMMFVH